MPKKPLKTKADLLCEALDDVRLKAVTELKNSYKRLEEHRDLDGDGIDLEDGPCVPGYGNDQVAACVGRVFEDSVEIDDASSSSEFLKFEDMDTDTLIDVLAAMEELTEELPPNLRIKQY
jgi:hypothetical protein